MEQKTSLRAVEVIEKNHLTTMTEEEVRSLAEEKMAYLSDYMKGAPKEYLREGLYVYRARLVDKEDIATIRNIEKNPEEQLGPPDDNSYGRFTPGGSENIKVFYTSYHKIPRRISPRHCSGQTWKP